MAAEQVVAGFVGGAITWDTFACVEGAKEWTMVRHLGVLVDAIRAAAPPSTARPVSTPLVTSESSQARPISRQVVEIPAVDVVELTAPPDLAQLDLAREIAKQEQYRDQLRDAAQASREELELYTERLRSLKEELTAVEEAVDIQSFGFYRPHYGFPTSSLYEARLDDVRARQEQLLKAGTATVSGTKWTVDGSAKKGAAMARDQSKLMLRAFNGESDAAIAKVKYDNIATLEKRIDKALTAINKLGATKHIAIAPEYASLKLEELRLVHEHREKLQEEREAQRAIKEQMKEEQKAEQEIAQALEKAQKEEAQNEEALRRARLELAESTGRQHEKLEQLVSRLETELSEALDRKAKAIARAQLTKSGHVYVLSNIGCFGTDCYKIGMTRRLEPLERVLELGDASVPFQFDVHAMIYSDDAPALERALHESFAHRRVNRVNLRKEFFRVTLDEIFASVEKLHGTVTFVTMPAAEEFRKTRALMESSEEFSAPAASLAGHVDLSELVDTSDSVQASEVQLSE
jgi:hypothetical protein